MNDVRPGGKRRIDRVLDDGFIDDLSTMTMEDLRTHRAEAEQEEVDMSYLRKLLHGRMDIMKAELRVRSAGGSDRVVDDLGHVLADDGPTAPFGLGRHSTLQPSRVDEHHRRVEKLVADVGLSDAHGLSDEQLRAALSHFAVEERTVSDLRRAVQRVMDLFGTEIARRYRDGEASVDTLLTREQS
ncbi:MAG: aerial mycelium formation protein [Pseudonocardiales bacterium]|nr:MAG: aerial mycelium formation protein [Pseudonocardiales bacterium]